MADFEEFAERLAVTRVVVDGSMFPLAGAVVIHGQNATATGQPGRTWWHIEGTLARPPNALQDVSVSFEVGGRAHAGRGSLEPGPVTSRRVGDQLLAGPFPVTIHGSGDLDPPL